MHILCPHCRNPIELVDLRAHQEIACLYGLVVSYFYVRHQSRRLRAERRKVRANIGVVGGLFHPITRPGFPITRNDEDQGHYHRYDREGH